MPKTAAAKKAVTKPTPLFNYKLLGRRDPIDRDMIITLLEREHDMPSARRERFAAMMFLDWNKMNEDQQRRFAVVMEKGNPDERHRIGCLVTNAKK